MSAPDRSADVAAFLRSHRALFEGEGAPDDVRRAVLDPLCRFLNQMDGGLWGKLIKRNQGDKIPADIIVWKPTEEHFDVMTGADDPRQTQPMWTNHGPIQDGWEWLAVEGVDEDIDEDNPPPVDPPPVTEYVSVLAGLESLRREVSGLKLQVQLLVEKPDPVLPPIQFPTYTTNKLPYFGTVTLTPPPQKP